ncbi:-Serine--tRNA ligase [Babesia bigemina]|uniref:Serine--tRNA ligase n=1 Tax=Babesia bigemina TaxID=5866 RepID=A0A061DB47_BABBI|nr:-Serine--tRNA ligase [Babesia bigemina]CDR97763.1 -Serine--tRNA ligase [Babesia bigemina]|eukprot:XP_012769949.1 -Serine--tRNA ligase [Babesia bigemina]
MHMHTICLSVLVGILPLLIEGCRGHFAASRYARRFGFLHPIGLKLRNASSTTRLDASGSDVSGDASPDCYSDSETYKTLSAYFTDQERIVDEQSFGRLKNSFVRKKADGNGFIPLCFNLDALSAVPEVFHANFLSRGEDHWQTLLSIRRSYLEKVASEEELSRLSLRRSELAKAFHIAPSSDQASLRESSLALRNETKAVELHIKELNEQLDSLIRTLPNIILEDVPKTELVVEKISIDPTPSATTVVVPHHEVIERFSDACVSRSTKISGTGFSAYSGDISRLERALFNYMLDTHHKLFGYKELSVPFVVSASALRGTGHLPRFEEDLFKLDERHQCNGDRGYLIPTGEIPLLALFGNSRVPVDNLPLWLMTYTPCFRSEIQDYGRETRGLIRNHQFGKVELVCLCDSTGSDNFHNLMLSHIEYILDSLSLPYRRVLLPANQLGSTSSKTVDFEVYFPSLRKYIEVSSCSNTLDFQSNRLNVFSTSRSRIHCINGSGVAIGRTLSAILENHQSVGANERLEITVPQVLTPYLNGDHRLLEPLP